MGNRCLPHLGRIYLRKRKSTKEEIKMVVEDKSRVHESSPVNKNSSFREKEIIMQKDKEMSDEKLDSDTVVEAQKDENLVEQGSESVDLNPTQVKQHSIQHQAIQAKIREETVPKFGEWNTSGDSFTTKARKEPLRNEFNKVKTFDLREVKSTGKGRKAIAWSRIFSIK